ncbi:MAG: hypothetical protein ACREAF_05360 [Nitrosopumilaceae archaeon]
MDKRIFSAGVAMIAVGISGIWYLNETYPVWNPQMPEEDKSLLLQAQATSGELSRLFAIVATIGFLLLLISFGLKRKKGGAGKILAEKPAGT